LVRLVFRKSITPDLASGGEAVFGEHEVVKQQMVKKNKIQPKRLNTGLDIDIGSLNPTK
jgi:hypothetical protein